MIIKSIKWITNEEAEVHISDGRYTCTAFSWPCKVNSGDHLTDPLHVFSIRNAMLSDQATLGVWNISDTKLDQKVVAKIVNIVDQIVAIGDIHMVIDDPLPGGFETGSVIEFECARIDLWE